MEQVDVLVLGGGPAGTTVASLVKRYTPDARVVVVERERFPRHHIGESLIADINRLLHDIGVYDRIASAGFLEKYGSTFVWGRDRTPWSIEFANLTRIPGFDADPGYQTGHTWHVPRHRYDEILMDHAIGLGVEWRHAVAEARFAADGRIESVDLDDGTRLSARFVVDATGQHSQFARRFGTRTFDPELRNIATYAYYEGARLDPALSGTWERSRIAVVTVTDGWIWYIPLARGLMSVGFVTSSEALARRRGRTPAEHLDEAIAECAELRPLLESARRIRFADAPTEVLTIRDYCYSVAPLHGPGWVLCGDASGFVDPILSVGCYLAQAGASFVAHVLNAALAEPNLDPTPLFAAYEEHTQFSLAAFRRMTYMFYGFNEGKESWWWEAKKILRARALPRSVEPKSAFLAIATGYGINRPVYHEAISDFGVNIFDDFYRNLVEADSIRRDADFDRGARYRFVHEARFDKTYVPMPGTGRVGAVDRVTFPNAGDEGPSRLLLPSAYSSFLRSLDGRTVAEALSGMAEGDGRRLQKHADAFTLGLVDMGIVSSSTSTPGTP